MQAQSILLLCGCATQSLVFKTIANSCTTVLELEGAPLQLQEGCDWRIVPKGCDEPASLMS